MTALVVWGYRWDGWTLVLILMIFVYAIRREGLGRAVLGSCNLCGLEPTGAEWISEPGYCLGSWGQVRSSLLLCALQSNTPKNLSSTTSSLRLKMQLNEYGNAVTAIRTYHSSIFCATLFKLQKRNHAQSNIECLTKSQSSYLTALGLTRSRIRLKRPLQQTAMPYHLLEHLSPDSEILFEHEYTSDSSTGLAMLVPFSGQPAHGHLY